MKFKKLFGLANITIAVGILIGALMIVLMVQIGTGLEKEGKTLMQTIGEKAKKAKIEFDKGYKNDSIR